MADIATIVGIEINGLPDSNLTPTVSMADTAVHNVEGELTIPLKKGFLLCPPALCCPQLAYTLLCQNASQLLGQAQYCPSDN